MSSLDNRANLIPNAPNYFAAKWKLSWHSNAIFINANNQQEICIKPKQKEAVVTVSEEEPRTNGLFVVIG